jgi:hypothetical protein
LPIEKLVIATNENDILTRFFKTGVYSKPNNGVSIDEKIVTEGKQSKVDESGVKETLSPAMDILVSSNFERLLWYLVEESEGGDRAGEKVSKWMEDLKRDGQFEVSRSLGEWSPSNSSHTNIVRLEESRWSWQEEILMLRGLATKRSVLLTYKFMSDFRFPRLEKPFAITFRPLEDHLNQAMALM